jgi:hypothetical protein
VTYPSSNYFNNINNLVQRYTASRTALRNLPKYETTGTFSIPLVVLHNTGDPIVPYWHATLYQAKVTSPSRFQLRTSASYGHCNFTQQEILDAFNALGGMISPFSLQEAQSKLTPEQYAEYQEFLENSGQLPVDSGQ